MGININIDDDVERMKPDKKITFDSLDFIADRFEDLHLQKPKLPMEEEQPPSICAFFTGLEETMNVGPRVLAQHLNHYGRDVFTKLGRESNLEATL